MAENHLQVAHEGSVMESVRSKCVPQIVRG